MTNKEQQNQLNIGLVIEEYEAALSAVMRENIQLKAIIKQRNLADKQQAEARMQKEKADQEAMEAAMRHEAPPAAEPEPENLINEE